MGAGQRPRAIDLEHDRIMARLAARHEVYVGIKHAIVVASCLIPLIGAKWIVETVAGEETTFSFSVTITVSIMISVTLAATSVLLLRQTGRQKKELVRLRTRKGHLEWVIQSSGLPVPPEVE